MSYNFVDYLVILRRWCCLLFSLQYGILDVSGVCPSANPSILHSTVRLVVALFHCSAAYQRIAWEALKKSINGLINKVNTSNVAVIVQELIQENIIRGRSVTSLTGPSCTDQFRVDFYLCVRGLLIRSLLNAQAASPTFTHVYAGLVAVLNTKV